MIITQTLLRLSLLEKKEERGTVPVIALSYKKLLKR